MMQTYTKQKLYDIANENYLALIKFCNILEQEGYWGQARSVLNKSIYECLDLYVQAVLVQLAIMCESAGTEQRKFICSVSRFYVFNINEEEEFSPEVCEETRKAAMAPPVLLQLCGLRDDKEKSGLAGLFFDALINIIMAQAYLDNNISNMVSKYITELYKRVSVFLYNNKNSSNEVDEKYIFYKISNTDLEASSRGIYAAGEDFEIYKSEILRIPSKAKNLIKKRQSGFASEEEELHFREYMKNKLKKNTSERSMEQQAAEIMAVYEEEDNDNQYTEKYKEEDNYSQYIGNYEEYEDDIEEKAKILIQKEEAAHIEETVKEIKQKTRLEELLTELDGLVGLTEVKKEINSLINLIKVKKLREKYCLPGMDMSYHMVFTGNPGTGKTTVARLVAEIYKEIGLLSKGNLVETDRAGLVAGFVGQTAIKVTEVVERAVGGVLFIDEAYSLSGSIGANDFGGEAIDTLVKLMEDHRDDLVVIVAGYTKEMEGFLKANTGLVSRFNKYIEFPDYSEDELINILDCMSSKAGFIITEEAVSIIKGYLEKRTQSEMINFGNARGIRNMFEKIVVNQANRIVDSGEPTIEQLTLIQKEDVNFI